VTEYNKRLEKTTQQVTAAEQTLSAELKTVEPKKAEQIAKILHDFEERYCCRAGFFLILGNYPGFIIIRK